MTSGSITQAFVLGAGLGTRLRPLTEQLPKPLVPIFQKRLITFAFDQLIDLGIQKLFVNTHHQPERFEEILGSDASRRPGPRSVLSLPYGEQTIEFFHEPILLETAGGIANLADSLGEGPLLVYNGDILTDLPLAPLLETHFSKGNIVTLALRSQAGPQHIAFDPVHGRILDIRNHLGTGAAEEFVFSGIYVVERKFVDRLERGVKRSVIPIFLELLRGGEAVGGVVIDEGHWWDVGNREAYLQLHRELPTLPFPAYPVADSAWREAIHASAEVDPAAELHGCSVVGAGCRVEAGAILHDTIVWPGAQIASRSDLQGCIVRSQKRVEGIHLHTDI
jgi:NDP-sugar pyrophosphorylase family protein